MDPSTTPPPSDFPLWKEALLVLSGALLASWKKIFQRHEKQNDDEAELLKKHTEELAKLTARLMLIESRPASITVSELDLAVERALNRAKDLFTPQHEELAKKAERAIEQSKLETQQLVTECNGAIRRDLGGAIDKLREDVVPALNAVTTALQQSHELMRQYTGLVEKITEALSQADFNRRKR